MTRRLDIHVDPDPQPDGAARLHLVADTGALTLRYTADLPPEVGAQLCEALAAVYRRVPLSGDVAAAPCRPPQGCGKDQ